MELDCRPKILIWERFPGQLSTTAVDARQERHRRGLWLGWWRLWCFSHGLQPFDVPPLIATTARTRIHQKKWMPKITSLRLQCLSCDDGWCLHHGAVSGLVWLEEVLCTESRICAWSNCQAQGYSLCESKRDLDLLVSGVGQFLVSGRRLLCEIATEDVEVAR